MIVLIGSDFHGDAEAFRRFACKAEDTKADALIICGDITHFGSIEEAKSLLSLLNGLQLPFFFVPGNCDPPELDALDIERAHCLHGRYGSYNCVTFFGVGGGPISPFGTPFEMTEEQMQAVLMRKPDQLLTNSHFILISHTPPKNTKLDRISSGQHIGSESIRTYIEKKKPSAVLCGHVHEARGLDRINGTILVNPGPARHRNCALADTKKEVEVRLDNL